jgi:hypothetical protein
VCGFEVFVAWSGLVHLDDYETRGKRSGTEDVKEEVGERAGALLFGGVGRLQDESCLDGEQKASLLWYQ